VKPQATVPIDELCAQPYASILCFPHPNPKQVEERIAELKQLHVETLEFSGSASLFGVKLPVLGKGFVGIVVVAHRCGERLALKILRQDSGRTDLLHEAEMLRLANAVDVAPKLAAASKNFLLMQLIEGDLLPNWLEKNREKTRVQKVLVDVLEQCWRLDQAVVDHGELSKAPKHVLVDAADKPFIVDFETASSQRRPANVTAVCQYLFAGASSASKALAEVLGEKSRLDLVEALKTYKKERCRSNFERLLRFVLS
jgi:putative serine/threonine protein kinase